jgi:hypothetical protein
MWTGFGYVGFEIIAISISVSALCDMKPCSLVGSSQNCGGIYHIRSWILFYALKTESVSYSETSVYIWLRGITSLKTVAWQICLRECPLCVVIRGHRNGIPLCSVQCMVFRDFLSDCQLLRVCVPWRLVLIIYIFPRWLLQFRNIHEAVTTVPTVAFCISLRLSAFWRSFGAFCTLWGKQIPKAHSDVINCAVTNAIIATFSVENISKTFPGG